MRDEEGEPIHTIRHRGIRDAKIAATLAAQKTRPDTRRELRSWRTAAGPGAARTPSELTTPART
jgi:hypothetical protein